MSEVILTSARDVPGYEGIYKANPYNQIFRCYKNGKMKLMTQYFSHRKYMVKLTRNGKSAEVPAATVILLTFKGPCPVGMVPYHKNGIKLDNRLDNLDYIKSNVLGRLTGAKSRSQSVIKIDENGEPVESYRSAREAGRKNYMSYQTIMDRCNGKVKKAFALDGYSYEWEDKKAGRPNRRKIEVRQ